MSSDQLQLINELRNKITDAHKRINTLEIEIVDKVSEISRLKNEFALNNSYKQSIISKLERTSDKEISGEIRGLITSKHIKQLNSKKDKTHD